MVLLCGLLLCLPLSIGASLSCLYVTSAVIRSLELLGRCATCVAWFL